MITKSYRLGIILNISCFNKIKLFNDLVYDNNHYVKDINLLSRLLRKEIEDTPCIKIFLFETHFNKKNMSKHESIYIVNTAQKSFQLFKNLIAEFPIYKDKNQDAHFRSTVLHEAQAVIINLLPNELWSKSLKKKLKIKKWIPGFDSCLGYEDQNNYIFKYYLNGKINEKVIDLRHDNLLNAIELIHFSDCMILIFPKEEGIPLDNALTMKYKLDLKKIMMQIINVILFFENKQLFLDDFKMGNILVNVFNSEIKVIDYFDKRYKKFIMIDFQIINDIIFRLGILIYELIKKNNILLDIIKNIKSEDISKVLIDKSLYYREIINFFEHTPEFNFLSKLCNFNDNQYDMDEKLYKIIDDIPDDLFIKYDTNLMTIINIRSLYDYTVGNSVINFNPLNNIDWINGFIYCIEKVGVIIYNHKYKSFLMVKNDEIEFPSKILEGLESFKECATRSLNNAIELSNTNKIYHEFVYNRNLYYILQTSDLNCNKYVWMSVGDLSRQKLNIDVIKFLESDVSKKTLMYSSIK